MFYPSSSNVLAKRFISKMQTYLVRENKFLSLFFIFFILLWIILSGLEIFPVQIFVHGKILSSLENCIYQKFYQVWCCTDFYPVYRLLFSVQTFIQCRDFYPVQRRFFLTKQQKISHTETIIQDFKDYNCNYIIVKEYQTFL